MQETQDRSLGQEDPLEKETATHSSILAWRIPWTEEPDCLQSMGSQRVGHNLATKQQQQYPQVTTFKSATFTDSYRPLAEADESRGFSLQEKKMHRRTQTQSHTHTHNFANIQEVHTHGLLIRNLNLENNTEGLFI